MFQLMFCGLVAQKTCDTSVVRVDANTFKILLEKKDGKLIDVRTPQEFKTGYISGAVNIDYRSDNFKEKINKLDKSKTYYVYCEVGGRSSDAAIYMKTQGFCKVVTLQRGLHAWKMLDYPIIIPEK